jgi:hypothetical protein
MPKFKKICKNCGNEFETRYERSNFCSISCSTKFAKGKNKIPLFQKICNYCGNAFETRYSTQECCSRSCSSKFIMNDPERRKRMSEFQLINQNNPVVKEKRSKQFKEYYSHQENRDLKSKIVKEYFNHQENRDLKSKTVKEYFDNNPDAKEKISAFQKEYQNRPEVKEYAKEVNNRPDVKKRKSDASKIAANKPEFKENISKIQKALWSSPEYADKRMKGTFKYKDYLMPSGIIVKVQGNEPKALDILLKKYSENDIIVELKNMIKTIGHIYYIGADNKTHEYHPDIYIKNTNTIIEVKSLYFFNLHKQTNLTKEKACLQQGFNFEFMIID